MNEGSSVEVEAGPADTTTASFRSDVLAGSMQQVVLVDFWAPWCGPCKQLGPVLEKAVAGADGKVKLFKMNIDDHPQIAGQLGIQSIPAVIAFQRGQPVDGFVGALPESQIVAFLERLVGPLSPDDEKIAAADSALTAGNATQAVELAEEILASAPENVRALSVYLRALLELGEGDRAIAILESLPDELRADPALKAVEAATELLKQSANIGDVADLQRRVNADPKDNQARFDLALAISAKDKASAADLLLDIVKTDRNWNDDAARKQLLQFFDVWGPMEPATKAARRKLSAMLFS